MKSQNINYLPKLDHLRFFAALLVAIYHYYYFQSGFYTQFKDPAVISKSIGSAIIIEGHTGVALFLVLSGFIFSAIGYGRKLHYWHFVQNRLLRIMPLYALFVLAGAFLASSSLQEIIASLCFLPPIVPGVNFVQATPHLWTISVEFQFYLLFPFLIGFLYKYGFRYAAGLVLLLILLRTLIWLGPKDMKGVQSLVTTLLGRLDQFMIGMVCGAIFSGRSSIKKTEWLRHPLCFLIAAVVTVAVLYGFHRLGGYRHLGGKHWLWIIWPTVEATVWAGVILTYTMARWDWPSVLSRGLAHLGTLSYSIYITHWLFVHNMPFHQWIPQLSRSMPTNAALSVVLVVMPIIVGFSWLIYLVIEKPFFELRKSYLIRNAEDTNQPKDLDSSGIMPGSAR
jgi:peptidoglycan/LPS O-acetylase OafA/YrhL